MGAARSACRPTLRLLRRFGVRAVPRHSTNVRTARPGDSPTGPRSLNAQGPRGDRGEIAARVIRAAHELGISTVGVYTPRGSGRRASNQGGRVVRAREPDHPVRGYLNIEALIATALDAGADGLHPGYGFLSESAALAEACHAAGITFVGPPPDVLRITGDNVNARNAAVKAGLPVLRASPPLPDGKGAAEATEQIGFPMFVKASAGGGGRGLRLVRNVSELQDAVSSAAREAAAAFGDGTLFLELAVERPRHIKVQVLGDSSGDCYRPF